MKSNNRTIEQSNNFSRGFTVLELLVASLLLAMLVTMLTMIFNQSSIAWRTGVASVTDLQDTREQMGGYHDVMDDALPGIGQSNDRGIDDQSRQIRYRTVSIFRNWSGSGTIQPSKPSLSCQGRLVDQIDWSTPNLSQFNAGNVMKGRTITGLSSGKRGQSKGGFAIGVRSAGPDRQMDTPDDINTFPEEIE